jgi:hypothetical protein
LKIFNHPKNKNLNDCSKILEKKELKNKKRKNRFDRHSRLFITPKNKNEKK